MKRTILLAATAVLFLSTGCTKDPEYYIRSFSDIDTDITLFSGNGLQIPIGSTDKIFIGTLMDTVKARYNDFGQYLEEGPDGSYSISVSGQKNLNEELNKIDLSAIKSVDEVKITSDFTVPVSGLSIDKFKTKAYDYENKLTIPEVKDFKFSIPAFVQETSLKSGMFDFRPAEKDLSFKNVFNGSGASTIVAFSNKSALQALASSASDKNDITIPATCITDGALSISIDKGTREIQIPNSKKVAKLDNFKIASPAAVSVKITVKNSLLTAGSVDFNMPIDFPAEFTTDKSIAISGTLNKANGWTYQQTLGNVTGFASGYPEIKNGKIIVDGKFKLKSGASLTLNGAKTSQSAIEAWKEDMQVCMELTIGDIVISSFDITLSDDVKYVMEDLDIDIKMDPISLPEGLESVNKIIVNQSKKLKLEVDSKNLNGVVSQSGTKRLNLTPDVTITFPAGIKILEADENNQVHISGSSLPGKIIRHFTVSEITPSMSEGKVVFDSKGKIQASAKASGCFDFKNLPKGDSDDIEVTAVLSGELEMSDFEVKVADGGYSADLDFEKKIKFEMDGLDEFGEFSVTPKDPTTATVKITLPSFTEVSVSAKDVKLQIPEFLKINPAGLTGFDSDKNILTINGTIPSVLNFPVTSVVVRPEKDDTDGKVYLKGDFKLSGKVNLDGDVITKKTLDLLSGVVCTTTANIPAITPKSVALVGDFKVPVDYKYDFTIVDKGQLPSMVKALKSAEFAEGTKFKVDLAVTDLPNIGTGDYYLDGTLTLPEFIITDSQTPNVVKIDQKLSTKQSGSKTAYYCTIESNLLGIGEIADLQNTAIGGQIKVDASLVAKDPFVEDISTISSTVTGGVSASISSGNGKIVISKISGNVDYGFNQSFRVADLGSLVENLKDIDLSLKLMPEITLLVSTNIGIPIDAKLSVDSYVGGSVNASCVVDVELPYSTSSSTDAFKKFYLADNIENAPSDAEAHKTTLSSLLSAIPDSLVVSINVDVDDEKLCVIEPSASYGCDIVYGFKVPFGFSDESNLTYRLKIDSGLDSFRQVFSFCSDFTLTADVINTLPCEAKAAVGFFDKNNVKLPFEKDVEFTIPASTGSDSPAKLELIIKPDKNADFSKLDHITVDLELLGKPGIIIGKNDYLQIKEIVASLPEGVNISISK